jgi:membrane-associated phospholipid phosphatase
LKLRQLIRGLAWLALYATHCVWAAEFSYPAVVANDVKHVVTAPTRWDQEEWHRAEWAMLGIVGTAAIIDKPLQDEIRRHAPNDNRLVQQVERLGAQYAIGVLGGFYLAGAAGSETAAQVAQDGLAASLIASGIITPTIKLVVGRSRPRDHVGTAHFQPFSDLNASFPSGHTTEAFALAGVIASHYEEAWIGYSAYTLAGLVGLARSYHDAHFASDIAAGALIGTWTAKSVVAHNRQLRNGAITLSPEISGDRIAVRLSKNF